jgi:hypothetical protein
MGRPGQSDLRSTPVVRLTRVRWRAGLSHHKRSVLVARLKALKAERQDVEARLAELEADERDLRATTEAVERLRAERVAGSRRSTRRPRARSPRPRSSSRARSSARRECRGDRGSPRWRAEVSWARRRRPADLGRLRRSRRSPGRWRTGRGKGPQTPRTFVATPAEPGRSSLGARRLGGGLPARGCC